MTDVGGPLHLPDVLRAVRRQRGFSQPRMADLLGVSLRQYQRWEHGSSLPRARELRRIAVALQVEPAPHPVQPWIVQQELLTLRQEVDELRTELARLQSQLAAPVQHVA